MVLSQILNISSEDIVSEVQYYKERFEEEGSSYILERAERIINDAQKILENFRVDDEYNITNDEEFDDDYYDNIDDTDFYGNDDFED